MPGLILSDELRSKLEKILLQETIYNKRNHRPIARFDPANALQEAPKPNPIDLAAAFSLS